MAAILIVLLASMGIAISLTFRVLVRRAREESRRFASMFFASPTAMSLSRLGDRVVVDVNDAYLRTFGITREHIVGRTAGQAGVTIDEAARTGMFERLGREGQLRDVEIEITGVDGVRRFVMLSSQIIELDGERLAMSAYVDVTASREAQSRARTADERLSELATCIDSSFWLIDLSTSKMLYISPAYERLFGRTCADHLANPADWLEAVHPEDRPRMEAAFRKTDVANGTSSEFRIVLPDGRVRWICARVTPIRDSGGQLVRLAGVCDDITVRKEAELAARASNERFQQLAESIHEVFWMTDVAKQQMLYISPAYTKITGRSVESLYANPMQWVDAIHPDDRERVIEAALTKQLSGDYDIRYRVLHISGEVRWMHDRAFPVRDDAGNVIRIAGICDDVTEHQLLQEQMQQSQKLESIGLLAGGVAHDFNNILSVIISNSELLSETLSPGPERDMVLEIDSAANRAASLTKQLLAFSRKQLVKPVVLALNSAVEETRRMLHRLLGEKVSVRLALDPDVGNIRIDRGQLAQVLMNLCLNARDAMGPDGGKLLIETRSERGEAWLIVSDSGSGMPEHVRLRVFDPFFTTKEVGKGTGLGLSVVHGIVEQAGGTIEVESELGKGSIFRLRFPTLACPLVESQRIEVIRRPCGTERVLLVDDDRHLRVTAARALRLHGFEVIEATSGAEALEQLHDSGRRVSLLITDIVMPAMNGPDLARAAVEEFPGLRVLYTSGYSSDEVVRQTIMQSEGEFLAKPFGSGALVTKVRALLDT